MSLISTNLGIAYCDNEWTSRNHLMAYYQCANCREVPRYVLVIDQQYGGRFADYKYDMQDPCSPFSTLLAIKDRRTGLKLYSYKYYFE